LIFGRLFDVVEFQPVQVAVAGRLDRDIALVLDVSGSMDEFGRFDALKNALAVFLNELSQSQQEEFVSLVVYNDTARKLQTLTPNLTLINRAFSRSRPGGFTAIGLGLDAGIQSLLTDPAARSLVTKTVILMTDGNHNTGISPLAVAPKAVANRIVVHTITFSSGANQSLMRSVANQTGGLHLHADTNAQLIQVFREIALAIPVTLTE
jgi:Mg-chelatase subunit ChlD